MLDEMIEEGFIIQSNAESFIRFGRRRVLKMLEEGKIHLLGSDCHNMEKRAPNIGAALDVIEKKLGSDAVKRLCDNSLEIFKEARAIYP
jgi:protein-tyrosine phosphatase